MDQGTLVAMRLEDGKRLIDRLVEEGIGVTAACWLGEAEEGRWFLYIATPLVGEDGATRKAYGRVSAVIRQLPPPFWIDPLEVKLVGAESAIAKAVQELHRRRPAASPFPYVGTPFGGLSIEGAYVYPPAPAPVK